MIWDTTDHITFVFPYHNSWESTNLHVNNDITYNNDSEGELFFPFYNDYFMKINDFIFIMAYLTSHQLADSPAETHTQYTPALIKNRHLNFSELNWQQQKQLADWQSWAVNVNY